MASSMVFLVLPAIAEDFDMTLGAAGWIVIVEALIISAFLLPVGALADSMGRRRVLFAGMVLFGIGSVLVGLAGTFALVIGARIVMAVGNTLVQSIGTGLLVASFPPEERGLALGAQTTAVAVGAASGPLVAGFALEALSWESLFLLLAIPSALSAVAVLLLIDDQVEVETHDRGAFDWRGGALSALSITALVVAINNPLDLDWTSPFIAATAVLGVLALGAFIAVELRHPAPMFPIQLFSISAFRTAVGVRVIGFLSSTTMMFLLPVFLLSYRDESVGAAGVILFVNAVGLGLSAQMSGRMYDTVGPRLPSLFGLILQSACFALLAFADRDTSLLLIAVASITVGAAVGFWNVPNNSAMLGATPAESLGVGGAFTNVTRTMGNVLGQAAMAAVVVGVMLADGFDTPLGEIADNPAAGDAFAAGWKAAFAVAAVVALAAAALATRLPSTSARPPSTRPARRDEKMTP